MSKNSAKINKLQFKKLNNRYYNKRKKIKNRNDQIFKKNYVLIKISLKINIIIIQIIQILKYIQKYKYKI